MKRFVLLDEPGKPSLVTGASGRPLVRCETPGGAAELQIGGAEIADNLAFLPVEIRDATDTVGANVMHVKMGLVRENGEWKLLSVGLVLLDLPSLSAEWDAAEIESTEQAAIEPSRRSPTPWRLTVAPTRDCRTRSRIWGLPSDGAASPEAAGLLDADLAAGAQERLQLPLHDRKREHAWRAREICARGNAPNLWPHRAPLVLSRREWRAAWRGPARRGGQRSRPQGGMRRWRSPRGWHIGAPSAIEACPEPRLLSQ